MFNVAFLVTLSVLLFPNLSAIDADNSSEAVSVALCYAYDPPIASLQKFDWVVVDPDSTFNPKNVSNDPAHNTTWLAYLSVGEVTSQRSYYNQIPKDWIIGDNTAWGAKIINQTEPEWSSFFVNNIAAPQMDRGFEGFFLDTLDSYQLAVTTDEQRQQQQQGLANVILSLKSRFPDATVIFNRGFEIMSSAYTASNMVAFESLYSGWNQAEQKYTNVSQNDRDWLLARVQEIQSNYQLPVLSIDYCPDETCGKDTAKRILQHEIIPYVTDPGLQKVGVGPPNMY